MKDDKLKKKVASASATAGILIGSAVTPPDHLINQSELEKETNKATYIAEVQREEKVETKEKSFFEKLSDKIPDWLKQYFFIPLWTISSFLVELIIGLISSPILKPIISFILSTLFFMLVLFFSLKTIFPNLKLKDIFKPRNIIFFIIGRVVLSIADYYLEKKIKHYQIYSFIFNLSIGGILLYLIIKPVFDKYQKIKNLPKVIFPET